MGVKINTKVVFNTKPLNQSGTKKQETGLAQDALNEAPL